MSKVEHLGQVIYDFNIITFCSLGITKCSHIISVSGHHQKQKLIYVEKKIKDSKTSPCKMADNKKEVFEKKNEKK